MSQPPYQGGQENYPPQGGPGNYPPQGGQPYPQQPGGFGAPMDRGMVTTGLEFSGYNIVRYMGVVRGLTVRSRSVLGNIGAGFQSLVGGKITIYVELCEHAREEAFNLMMQHASQIGANAIVGMRYDANEVADGITEVLAYGTAVIVQPEKR